MIYILKGIWKWTNKYLLQQLVYKLFSTCTEAHSDQQLEMHSLLHQVHRVTDNAPFVE